MAEINFEDESEEDGDEGVPEEEPEPKEDRYVYEEEPK